MDSISTSESGGASSISLSPFSPQISLEDYKAKDRVIKQVAQTFLGYGGDRTADKGPHGLHIRIKVLEDVSEEIITIDGVDSLYKGITEESADLAIQTLNSECKAKFGLEHIPHVPINASASGSRSIGLRSESKTDQIVRVVRRLLSNECRLNEMPPLRKDLPSDLAQTGDGVVRSGVVYTGYDLMFTIDIDSNTSGASKQSSGGAGISVAKSVKAAISGKELSEQLKETRITNISVHAQGFGYAFPVDINSVSSLVDIDEVVERVDRIFFKQLPQLKRLFYIRKDDVVDRPLSIPNSPTLPAERLDFTGEAARANSSPGSMSNSSTEESLARFYQLADSVLTSCSPEHQANLSNSIGVDNKLRAFMGSMFQAIQVIFSRTCKIMSGRNDATSYTEVIGNTGVGKSLFVGYISGETIIKKTVNRNQVLDFKENSGSSNRPAVGHVASKTKGGEIYGRYIDTGGLFDTAGREANICNAIAISMVTRALSPNRLIVLIPPGCFDERAHGFLEIIRKLKGCIHNLTAENTWASIMFLVNDKEASIDERPLITKDRIRRKIENAIDILKEEQEQLIPASNRSIFNWLKNQARSYLMPSAEGSPSEKFAQISKLDSDVAKRYEELDTSIEVISSLLKKDNIAVVDFFGTATREMIDSWQTDPSTGHLNCGDFTMENLVEGGYDIFKQVLMAAASHFIGLFNKMNALKNLIENQDSDVRPIRGVIGRLKKDIDRANAMEKYKQDKLECEETLKQLKDQRVKLEEEKAQKMQRLEELKVDSPIPLDPPLQPDNPVEPRGWVAWFPKWTKTYRFEYSGPPIVRIEKVEPTKDKKYPGVYIDEDNTQWVEGKYSVSYRPGWYGYLEDSSATVKIYVKTKDHPSTQAEIDAITKDLTTPEIGLNDRINNLQTKIEGYKAHDRQLKTRIDEAEALAKRLESNKRTLQEKQDELKQLEEKHEANLLKQQKIRSELASLEEFCELLTKIIQSPLGLLDSKNESEQRIFKEFCANVSRLS